MYNRCVSRTLIQLSKQKGKDQLLLTVEYPTGFTTLPYEGGWKDQPHRHVVLFDIFFNAERRAVMKRLA